MNGERGVAQEEEDGYYDPELSFLHALERDVRRHAHHAASSRRRGHSLREHTNRSAQNALAIAGDPDAHKRRLRPAGGRIARRSLTLLALLSLIGASAFGAGRIFSGASAPDPAAVRQSAFATLDTGTSGDERWSLRVYTRGSELCRVLTAGETEASRCSAATSSADAFGATSAISPSHRYLFGLTGAAIAAISIHDNSVTASRVPTHLLSPSATRAARMRLGERWYVAILPRPTGEPDPPLRVQGLDRAGRPTGASLLDCPETGEPSRCRH